MGHKCKMPSLPRVMRNLDVRCPLKIQGTLRAIGCFHDHRISSLFRMSDTHNKQANIYIYTVYTVYIYIYTVLITTSNSHLMKPTILEGGHPHHLERSAWSTVPLEVRPTFFGP